MAQLSHLVDLYVRTQWSVVSALSQAFALSHGRHIPMTQLIKLSPACLISRYPMQLDLADSKTHRELDTKFHLHHHNLNLNCRSSDVETVKDDAGEVTTL